MKSQCIVALSIALLPAVAFSVDSIYCPQRQGYINIGMSQSEVVQACGQPTQKSSNIRLEVKIPMTQLIYTSINQDAVYPGLNSQFAMWSLPTGSQAQGTKLMVNIVENKVTSVDINGSSANGASICSGNNVQVGDDQSSVYAACGSPSLVNNTYTTKPIPKEDKPEIWIYRIDQYQPVISLTFIRGTLQSIE